MNRIVIVFFWVFLTSRFFTETLRVLPKALDLIDLGIPILSCLLFITRPAFINKREDRLLLQCIGVFVLAWTISLAINIRNVTLPAAALFLFGFLEGPLLFLSLNRLISEPNRFAMQVGRLLRGVFWLNVAIVSTYNLNQFIATRDPDVISGSFGLNCYYLAGFLLISATFFLGQAHARKTGFLVMLVIQIIVFVIYFFLQYRASLPFFVLAYLAVGVSLFSWRVARPWIFAGMLIALGYYAVSKTESLTEANLKFDDWIELAAKPMRVLEFGKTQAYLQTIQLMLDNPLVIIGGVGPGSFCSRANFVFSTEIVSVKNAEKGVGGFIKGMVSEDHPTRKSYKERYLIPLMGEAHFGTYRLSNPDSSYLSLVSEIGLIGAFAMIGLYFAMTRRTWRRLKLMIRLRHPIGIPLAAAAAAGMIYLCGLAFIEYVWEMGRSVLPVWLLMWAAMSIRVQSPNAGRLHKASESASGSATSASWRDGRPPQPAISDTPRKNSLGSFR